MGCASSECAVEPVAPATRTAYADDAADDAAAVLRPDCSKSAGSFTKEPKDQTERQQVEAKRISEAQRYYGINGDPDQFPYTHEDRLQDMAFQWLPPSIGANPPIAGIRAWADIVQQYQHDLQPIPDDDVDAVVSPHLVATDSFARREQSFYGMPSPGSSINLEASTRSVDSPKASTIRRRVVSFAGIPHVSTDDDYSVPKMSTPNDGHEAFDDGHSSASHLSPPPRTSRPDRRGSGGGPGASHAARHPEVPPAVTMLRVGLLRVMVRTESLSSPTKRGRSTANAF